MTSNDCVIRPWDTDSSYDEILQNIRLVRHAGDKYIFRVTKTSKKRTTYNHLIFQTEQMLVRDIIHTNDSTVYILESTDGVIPNRIAALDYILPQLNGLTHVPTVYSRDSCSLIRITAKSNVSSKLEIGNNVIVLLSAEEYKTLGNGPFPISYIELCAFNVKVIENIKGMPEIEDAKTFISLEDVMK